MIKFTRFRMNIPFSIHEARHFWKIFISVGKMEEFNDFIEFILISSGIFLFSSKFILVVFQVYFILFSSNSLTIPHNLSSPKNKIFLTVQFSSYDQHFIKKYSTDISFLISILFFQFQQKRPGKFFSGKQTQRCKKMVGMK